MHKGKENTTKECAMTAGMNEMEKSAPVEIYAKKQTENLFLIQE